MDEHSIFAAALECEDEAAVQALLDKGCGDDEVLRQHVTRLLDLHADADDFLEEPVLPDRTGGLEYEQPGATIGPYKLLEQIGEGGMGVVFAAQQLEPVQRKVAVKIIKPGMDTKQVIARFEAERQALALMEHPSIAKVLDAGTTPAGRPYFVMELVREAPITEFCDQELLNTNQRLDLFLAVCEAVQHAHHKGIIHRDLKPSNILVTLQDGRPVVKMIDFGVAKAVRGRLTDSTLYTSVSQVIGTPMYMSPEQAELTGLDVDTRSDVYSLGVVLYELLTGTSPLARDRFSQVGYDEMRRIIREEDPPKPSSRVSTLDGAASTILERRGTDSRRLQRSLRGELDWIVLKAIDKVRSRRYQSPADLANDIRRYQASEPVEACPPSYAYHIRKVVRRYRVAVSFIGAVMIVLAVSATASTWLAIRAVRAEQRAEEARAKAETEAAIATAINRFLSNDVLRQANPYAAPDADVKLRDVVERASRRIEDQFQGQPLVEAAIRMNLGTTCLHLGDYEAAAAHFDRAHELRRRALGERAPETLQAAFYQARVTLQRRGGEAAAGRFERLLRLQRREIGPEQHDTLLTMDWLGYCYVLMGRYADAEPVLRHAAESLERLLGRDHPDTLDCLEALVILHRNRREFDVAEKLSKEILQTRQRKLGSDHPQSIESLDNLARLYAAMEQHDRATALYLQSRDRCQTVYGPQHKFTLSAMRNLAESHHQEKHYEEAESLLIATLEGQVAEAGADHESSLLTMRRLASVYVDQRRFGEAEQLHLEVLRSRRDTYGDDHEFTLNAIKRLADVYRQQKRNAEATKLYLEIADALQRSPQAEEPETLDDLVHLARRLQDLKQYEPAVTIVSQVLEVLQRDLGVMAPETLSCQMRLAFLLKLQHRFEQAEKVFMETLERSRVALGDEHSETLRAANQVAVVWRLQGHYDKAETLCRQTLETRQRVLGTEHLHTLSSQWDLGTIYALQQRHHEAVAALSEAVEMAGRIHGPDHPRTRLMASELAAVQKTLAKADAGDEG